MESDNIIVFKNKKNKEIYEILNEFVQIRDKFNSDTSDLKLSKQYDQCYEKIIKKFSYIPDVHARKYLRYPNYADLVQEGMLGLVMAVNNFDMQRSRCFLKLANWYVKTRIKRAANKFDLISVPIYSKNSALQRVGSLPVIIYEDDCLYKKDNISHIKSKLLNLSPKRRKIFFSFYGFDIINEEIILGQKKDLSEISKEVELPINTLKFIINKINKTLLK